MSKVRSGPAIIPRNRARNFSQREAQKRLDETVPAFNDQVLNALYVNSVEADYYQVQDRTGKPCTCEKVPVRPEYSNVQDDGGSETNVPPIIPTADEDSSSGVSIKLKYNDLFGDSSAEKMYGETAIDVSGRDSSDAIPEALINPIRTKEGDIEYTETSMFGSNENCGICYRQGFQPGYKLYGTVRHVLTTLDIVAISGFTVVTSEAPNKFKRQGPETSYTYVTFEFNVPRYFQNCVMSVRNNVEILRGVYPTVDGLKLDSVLLRKYAGKQITVQLSCKEFTHLVFEFDVGVPKVKVNIGSETQTLDYSMLEAIGNFPVVLPPYIAEVKTSDIIVINNRRLVLKVIDKERKITADMKQLEWLVQTRVVQPSEPIRQINRGFKLF